MALNARDVPYFFLIFSPYKPNRAYSVNISLWLILERSVTNAPSPIAGRGQGIGYFLFSFILALGPVSREGSKGLGLPLGFDNSISQDIKIDLDALVFLMERVKDEVGRMLSLWSENKKWWDKGVGG